MSAFVEILSNMYGFDKNEVTIDFEGMYHLWLPAKNGSGKNLLKFFHEDIRQLSVKGYPRTDVADTFYKGFNDLLDHDCEISNGVRPYFAIDLDGFWMKTLFRLKEVASNKKGTLKILEVTDPRTNDTRDICFRYSEKFGGWYPSDPYTKEFVKLQNAMNPPTTLRITEFASFQEPRIDTVTGIIDIYNNFSRQGSSLQFTKVISQTDDFVELDYCRVSYPKRKHESVRFKYTIKIVDGKIEKTKEEIPMPEWYDRSHDAYDLSRHPLNAFMHHILPDYTNPLFEGQHIYITDYKNVYVKLHDTWIMVEKDWLMRRLDEIPELHREFLAARMIGIEI